MHKYIVFSFFLLSLNLHAEYNVFIYGEEHFTEACIEQRKSLAILANDGEITLAIENLIENTKNNPRILEFNKEIMGFELNESIVALETQQMSMIGVYYYAKKYIDTLFYKPSGEKPSFSELGVIFNNYETMLERICTFQEARKFCKKYQIKHDERLLNSYLIPYRQNFASNNIQQNMLKMEPYFQAIINKLKPAFRIEEDERNLIINSLYSQHNTEEEIAYVIAWRNYLMIENLQPYLEGKDIHIVLGANHVEHFKYLLEKENIQVEHKPNCFE